MVRTIDEASFDGTYGYVEKKRDEIMSEMKNVSLLKAPNPNP